MVRTKKRTLQPKKTCSNCGKTMVISNFYNTNSVLAGDGKLGICKNCVHQMIDYRNISTVYKILEQMDIPFLYTYWETAKQKNPDNPWGIYIRFANSKINEFKNAKWKDSIFSVDADKKHETPILNENFSVTQSIIEKWGVGYTSTEYEAFERKYELLKNNYPERTAMHTEALLKYIRYSVKEEIATANNNVSEAKSWGSLAANQATAAKINPSQLSAADLQDGLSTFGQLSRAVEQAQDIIPILPKFKEKPQDKVDFTLLCYINYVRQLKGLRPCEYKEIYKFYEDRKNEYKENLDFLQDENNK